MVVLMLERVPASLRGELSRWLIEPKSGVFVGTISAMVREKIWEQVCKKTRSGGAVLAYSTNSEQGFSLQVWGSPDRVVRDFEGLSLVTVPQQRL